MWNGWMSEAIESTVERTCWAKNLWKIQEQIFLLSLNGTKGFTHQCEYSTSVAFIISPLYFLSDNFSWKFSRSCYHCTFLCFFFSIKRWTKCSSKRTVCLFVCQIQTKAKKTLHENVFNHKAQFFIKQQRLKDIKKFQDFSTSFLCPKFWKLSILFIIFFCYCIFFSAVSAL